MRKLYRLAAVHSLLGVFVRIGLICSIVVGTYLIYIVFAKTGAEFPIIQMFADGVIVLIVCYPLNLKITSMLEESIHDYTIGSYQAGNVIRDNRSTSHITDRVLRNFPVDKVTDKPVYKIVSNPKYYARLEEVNCVTYIEQFYSVGNFKLLNSMPEIDGIAFIIEFPNQIFGDDAVYMNGRFINPNSTMPQAQTVNFGNGQVVSQLKYSSKTNISLIEEIIDNNPDLFRTSNERWSPTEDVFVVFRGNQIIYILDIHSDIQTKLPLIVTRRKVDGEVSNHRAIIYRYMQRLISLTQFAVSNDKQSR